jgi:hypothetical protein
MDIRRLLVGVLVAGIVAISPMSYGKTASSEQVIAKAETMWGGVITVDFSTTPPSVMAVPVTMRVMAGSIPVEAFAYGEELELVVETSGYYSYAVPKMCGDAHVLHRVIILKTGNAKHVGFEMTPIGEAGCVLTPQAVQYDSQPVREMIRGREAYRFSLHKEVMVLFSVDEEKCAEIGSLPTVPRD